MNTKPAPKLIKTKVASRNVTSSAKTGGLHSTSAAGKVQAGKKHHAKYDAGDLQKGSTGYGR